LFIPLGAAQGIFMTDELVSTTNAGATVYTLSEATPAREEFGKAYTASAFGALAYTTTWAYTVGTAFVVEDVMTGTAFISCDTEVAFRPGNNNAQNPVPTARMEFTKGGTVLQTVNLFSTRTCDGPSDIWEAVFEADALAGTDFPAGSQFGLNLILWVATGNPGSGAENVYVMTGSNAFPSGASGAGLPGGAQPDLAPATVFQNITDGFGHSFGSMQNASFAFNFTANGTTEFSLDANITSGLVNLTIVDAGGAELFNATVENGTSVMALDGANGNWTMFVAYDNFIGAFAVNFGVPAVDDDMENNGTMEPTGNETVAPANEDSPAFAVVVAIGALLWVRSRRR
jgi:hypothetical protein